MKKIVLSLLLLGSFLHASNYAYLGQDFRTLTQDESYWDASYSDGTTCENSYTEIPAGWHIASEERVQEVVEYADFKTHVLVASNGNAYGTKQFNAEYQSNNDNHYYSAGYLSVSGNLAKTNGCSMAVLLERDGKENLTLSQKTDNYAYLGQDFRTLTQDESYWDASYSDGTTCENSYTEIPAGWHIASEERVQEVVEYADFKTHVLVASNGNSYGTKSYSGGQLFSSSSNYNYLSVSGNLAKTNGCSIAVLLERDGKENLILFNFDIDWSLSSEASSIDINFSNSGIEIEKVEVQYRQFENNEWSTIEEASNSQITILELSSYTVYEIKVRFYNPQNGWSDYSDIKTVRTKVGFIKGVIWNLTNPTSTSIDFNVTDTNNSIIQDMQLEYREKIGYMFH